MDRNPGSELLAVITGQQPDQALHALLRHCEVTQRVSARVLLVRLRHSVESTPTLEGVHIFSTPDIPDEILELLNDQESLFVAAWRMRIGQEKKRLGEGLDWDAPGFKPPR